MVYVSYILFALLVVDLTDLRIVDYLPAVLFLAFTYSAFAVGVSAKSPFRQSDSRNQRSDQKGLRGHRAVSLLLLGSAAILGSLVTARYYTGQTPSDVVETLLSGGSTYYAYQNYFIEASIGSLSLVKLPYVVLLSAVHFNAMYGFAALVCSKGSLVWYHIVYLSLSSLAVLYFGVARGTNFELFEVVVLTLFSLKIGGRMPKRIPFVVFGVIVGLLGIWTMQMSMNSRHAGHWDIPAELVGGVSWELDRSLLGGLQFVVTTVSLFFGYFGYGLHYLNIFMRDIWLSDPAHGLAGLFPRGIFVVSGEDVILELNVLADKGVRWMPDGVPLVLNLGFVGFLLLVFWIGKLGSKLIRESDDVWKYMGLYLVLLQIMSIPIGNFIVTSSANKLIVALVGLVWVRRWLFLRASHVRDKQKTR